MTKIIIQTDKNLTDEEIKELNEVVRKIEQHDPTRNILVLFDRPDLNVMDALDFVQSVFPKKKRTCVICGKQHNNREFTCSDECHKKFVQEMIKQFGKYKRVEDMETGKEYKVPTEDIIEKGLKHADLVKYPKWRD